MIWILFINFFQWKRRKTLTIHTQIDTFLDVIANRPAIIRYIFDNNITDFQRFYKTKHNLAPNSFIQRALPIIARLFNGSVDIDDYHPNEGERASYEYAEFSEPGTGLDILLANRRLNAGNDANMEEASILLSAADSELLATLLFQMTNHYWSTMLQLHHSKFVNAKLFKLAETLVISDVTDDAAVIVAAQPPSSESIISELIDKKLKEILEKSDKTHDNTAKNEPRGKKQTRASQNKLKNNTPTKQNKKQSSHPKRSNRPRRQSAKYSNNNVLIKQKQTTNSQRAQKQTPRKKQKADAQEQDTTNASNNNTTNPRARARKTPRKATTTSKSNQKRGTNNSKRQQKKQR